MTSSAIGGSAVADRTPIWLVKSHFLLRSTAKRVHHSASRVGAERSADAGTEWSAATDSDERSERLRRDPRV